jgi:hypothetical protein
LRRFEALGEAPHAGNRSFEFSPDGLFGKPFSRDVMPRKLMAMIVCATQIAVAIDPVIAAN